MPRYAGKYTPRKPLEQIWNEYRTQHKPDSYGRWPVGYKNQIEHQRIENSPKTANPEYDANNRIIELYNKLKEERNSGERLPVGEPERKENQHEIQPDKTHETKAEQNRIETSPKTEPHQEPVEKQSESPIEKLGLPISHEFRQADITERPTDIRARRRPGFDPLETGW